MNFLILIASFGGGPEISRRQELVEGVVSVVFYPVFFVLVTKGALPWMQKVMSFPPEMTVKAVWLVSFLKT